MATQGAPTAPPAPVVVVGVQFVAPCAVPLTMTKKTVTLKGGGFTVADTNGAMVLRVEDVPFSFRGRCRLLDAAGHPLLSMKPEAMSTKWKAFRGDSTNPGDLLFSVKPSSLLQLKPEVDVFLAGNATEHVCDFKIKGSYSQTSWTCYLGNSDDIVAQMNRRFASLIPLVPHDTFGLTVYPFVDHAFVVALVAILDQIYPGGT